MPQWLIIWGAEIVAWCDSLEQALRIKRELALNNPERGFEIWECTQTKY